MGVVSGHRAAIPVITALLLLAACGSSPPTRFYTLSDTAPTTTPPTDVGLVSINRVSIPGEIDRPQIVRRMGSNQLNISDLDRWAAPLDETILRVLTDNIARRIPSPVAGQQHSVSVDIHEFYGDAGCNVTLRAVWTLRKAAGQAAAVVQQQTEEVAVPSSGTCPATLPATMSNALGQLSDRIIAAVARLPATAAKQQ
jgi:uncharacterized lipoprotein YmbA